MATLRDSLLAWAIYAHHGRYDAPGHLRRFCHTLERVERGETRRLINNWPPRHGKTMLLTTFAAWFLGRNPDARIIVGCYNSDLAMRFSRAVRRLVASERFAATFPGIALAADSQAAQGWELAGRQGGLRAVGVGAGITGYGGDLIIIDDPVRSRQDAESDAFRRRTWDWYRSDLYTRLEPGGRIICNQTRWHEDDLTGRLLEAEVQDPDADAWEHLALPAIGDVEGVETALWPERWPLERLRGIRATLGSYDWEALYQGRPRPAQGALFKREWFGDALADAAPEGLHWVWAWDLAVSTKASSDYTAGVKGALDRNGVFWIERVVRFRAEWPDVKMAMALEAMCAPGCVFALEAAAFQAAAVQELLRDPRFHRVAVRELRADKDKVTRARPLQARAEALKVRLVAGSWVQAFLDELYSFPLGAHDDQVDAAAYAYLQAAAGPVTAPYTSAGKARKQQELSLI